MKPSLCRTLTSRKEIYVEWQDQALENYAGLQEKCSSLSELQKYAFETIASNHEWGRRGYQMVVEQKTTHPDENTFGRLAIGFITEHPRQRTSLSSFSPLPFATIPENELLS